MKSKSLNTFQLKVVAIVGMTINHIGLVFHLETVSPVLEFIYIACGMLTFPIMAFFIVEGYYHTKDLKSYVLRLLAFAFISEWPFRVAITHLAFPKNIFYTLLLGSLLVIVMDRISDKLLKAILATGLFFLSLFCDWMPFGVPLIYCFYKTKEKPKQRAIYLTLTTIIMLAITVTSDLSLPDNLVWTHFGYLGLLTTIPLLNAYNGNLGPYNKSIKWGFYWFYPLHLALLYFIHLWLF